MLQQRQHACAPLPLFVSLGCPGVVTIVNPDGGRVSLNFTSASLRPGLDNMELYNSRTVDTKMKFWQAVPDPIDGAFQVTAAGGARRLSTPVSLDSSVITSGVCIHVVTRGAGGPWPLRVASPSLPAHAKSSAAPCLDHAP
jgi:hypothetical protein